MNAANIGQQAILAHMVNMPSEQCIAQWAQLSVQLSYFNVVIAIDLATFQSWTPADQEFVIRSYM
jgi:hypothetical protein